jgi:hypothetical protein
MQWQLDAPRSDLLDEPDDEQARIERELEREARREGGDHTED